MRSRLLAVPLTAVAMASVATIAEAQTRVAGVVTSSTGEPLAAVTVQVVGTTAGTLTNEAGRYAVVVPAGATTIRFRRIGYQQKQVAVTAGQTEINASLERDILQLEQVVVTGAATTQERRNVSTAVSTVSASEVTRTPAVSLDNALQGKIVGANINMNSGAPGGGGQIQIRGVTSILGNGEPLFVVDGVIISNAAFSTGVNAISRAGAGTTNVQDNPVNRLADINPNDIESIQVLKSAAASAIYGSKATNGVVLITTKRGSAGMTRTNLTQRVGTYASDRLLGSRRFTPATALEVIGSKTLVDQLCTGGTCPYYDYQGDLFGNNGLSYESTANVSGGTSWRQPLLRRRDREGGQGHAAQHGCAPPEHPPEPRPARRQQADDERARRTSCAAARRAASRTTTTRISARCTRSATRRRSST